MNLSENTARLHQLLGEEALPLHGFCAFSNVADSLLACRASDCLKAAFSDSPPRTVIVALFPYRHHDGTSNLSRYARIPDYHNAAGAVLERAAARLHETFPYQFLPFIDNSPLPEVRAAALAGLGCVGRHGLLIHPEYGSWVFIGTITTDMPVDSPSRSIPFCPDCGLCAAVCPGKCLKPAENSGKSKRAVCLSSITQKRGALTAQEEALIKENRTAWGCDRCQEACPLNAHAKIEPHPCFGGEYTASLTPDALCHLDGKAFGWRGKAVPARNLSLIDEKAE